MRSCFDHNWLRCGHDISRGKADSDGCLYKILLLFHVSDIDTTLEPPSWFTCSALSVPADTTANDYCWRSLESGLHMPPSGMGWDRTRLGAECYRQGHPERSKVSNRAGGNPDPAPPLWRGHHDRGLATGPTDVPKLPSMPPGNMAKVYWDLHAHSNQPEHVVTW
jgi:hypothetical protein